MEITAIEAENGPVRVWEEPKPNMDYVIGADIAEGKVSKDIHDPTGNKRDWSVAFVLKVKDASIVAQYKSQVDSATLAVDLFMLGAWYNWALLAPETNSMGIGVVHMLSQAGYPNLYQPKVGPFQANTGMADYLGVRAMGWVTTKATKPILVAAIHEALANGNRIPSVSLIRELKTIEFDSNGRIGAPQGGHDDQMIAYGIALVVLQDFLGGRAGNADFKQNLPDEDARIWRLVKEEDEKMAVEEEEFYGW